MAEEAKQEREWEAEFDNQMEMSELSDDKEEEVREKKKKVKGKKEKDW